MKKGLIQVYTGDGKGKTTAALGLTLRAVSQGFRVCFVYFHKNLEAGNGHEHHVLKKIGVDVFSFAPSHPGCGDKVEPETLRVQCGEALDFIRQVFRGDKYDLLILDEINIALRGGYLGEEDVVALLKDKPESLEIVLTGRQAPDSVKAYADLVSLICKEKHPFDKGLPARQGIEF